MQDTLPRKSRRACSDPTGNGFGTNANTVAAAALPPNYKGCAVCHNDDRYGFGSSVCGRCNRCHGCGSSNNGIGPIQAVYFGGKAIVKKALVSMDRSKGDDEQGSGEKAAAHGTPPSVKR